MTHETFSALDHLRQHELGERERRHDVGGEVLVEEVERGVDEPVHMAGPDVAAVVEEQVDPAPLLEHGRDRSFELRAVEEVGRDGQRLPAGRLYRFRSRRETAGERAAVALAHGRRVLARFALLLRPGSARDVVTRARQSDRASFADAAAGAGHERDSIIEASHLRTVPVSGRRWRPRNERLADLPMMTEGIFDSAEQPPVRFRDRGDLGRTGRDGTGHGIARDRRRPAASSRSRHSTIRG